MEDGEIDVQLLATQEKLETITSNIKVYIDKYDISKLQKDLDRSITTKVSDSNVDLESIKYQESDYIQQLEICNKLWFINGLIKELNSLDMLIPSNDDWKFVDFESSVSSYLKLRNKTTELISFLQSKSTGPIKIINEISARLEYFEKKLEELTQLYLHEFIKFDNGSIKYENKFNELSFKEFIIISNDLLSFKTNNELSKSFKFSTIFKDWLLTVLDKLDNRNKTVLAYDLESISLKVEQTVSGSEFSEYIKSIESIINFFNLFIDFNPPTDKSSPFNSLKLTVSKILLKSLKSKVFNSSNIYPLILDNLSNNENKSIIGQLQLISTLLSQDGWSRDSICDLEFWIDDLVNYWVNDLVDYSIDQIKELSIDLKLSKIGKSCKIKDIFNFDHLILKEMSGNQAKEGKVEDPVRPGIERKTTEDGWNARWSDDEEGDAWNEEIDLNVESPAKPKEALQLVGKSDVEDEPEDDDWDAWNEEADDSWVENDLKVGDNLGVKSLSSNSKTPTNATTSTESSSSDSTISYMYSQIPERLTGLIQQFFQNFENLKSNMSPENEDKLEEAETIFKSNIKKLLTCYFMIIESNVAEFYPNPMLFYNDYNKLLEDVSSNYGVDLKSCFNMNYRFVNTLTNNYIKELFDSIRPYESSLLMDNSTDSAARGREISELTTGLEIYFAKLYNSLVNNNNIQLNKQLTVSIILRISSSLYSILNSRLLDRTEIGSEESEQLSKLIDTVSFITFRSQNHQQHSINKEISSKLLKTQPFQKLTQIKLILESNLKSILDHFYDAKFYDLETFEIISLIKGLFVDSVNRQSVIDEINSIRNEQ